MRRVALPLLLVLWGCGGSVSQVGPTSTSVSTPASTTAIPDFAGLLVEPVPTGSADPAKVLRVPDAGGATDTVSVADARYLAAARPFVPYRGPFGTVTNATLIAMGRPSAPAAPGAASRIGACSPAPAYSAAGTVVSGAAAQAIHRAALAAYC